MDPEYFDERAAARFQQEVIERVRPLPGVREAGIMSAVPFRGVDRLREYQPDGYEKSYMANLREVTPGYFSVMRLALLRGRLLTDRNTVSSEPAVVISESVAREVFPGEEPIGKRLDLHGPRAIIGIVKDVRYKGLDQTPFPAIYEPAAQSPSELVCLVLRTAVDRQRTGAELRTVISAFAGPAILLTATGPVVVIAHSVAERRRELAIRSALGAQSCELMGLMIRQGLAPVILGAAIGLAGAWSSARILERFLLGVTLHDPTVYAGAGVFTVAIASLACFLARPASRQAGKGLSGVEKGLREAGGERRVSHRQMTQNSVQMIWSTATANSVN